MRDVLAAAFASFQRLVQHETRTFVRSIAVGLLLAIGLSGLSASAAHATKYVDRIAVGDVASGSLGGQFNVVRGIAVNDGTADGNGTDGWFYVSDGNNHRIQAFNAAGVFQWAIGRDVIDPAATTDTDLGDVFEKCTTVGDCKAGSPGTSTDGPAGELNNPMGIAVNQSTGDFYVRDRNNRRVQQFTADGDFVRMWGFDVITAGAPAPPNSNGTGFEVCDVTNGNVASDCKIGTSGSNPGGQFGTNSTGQTGVAVQQSTGDVFVVDPANRRFYKFEADGSLPVAIGSSAVFTAANQPTHIAVDDDTVYIAAIDTVNGGIARYDLTGGVLLAPIAISARAMEVDPNSGNLLVAADKGELGWMISELASPRSAATEVDNHVEGAGFSFGNANGFALNPDSGELVVAAPPALGHFIVIADDDGAPPADGEVLPATAVGAGGATLRGEITTADPLATDYRLEYSANGVDWVTAGSGQVGGNAAGVEVSAVVTGLNPNTVYRSRLVTSRAFGNPEVVSAELTFLTDARLPEVTDARAAEVTDTSARLQARINPHSTQTSYRFEYGAGNFHASVPVPDAAVGGGPSFVFVSQQIAGLSPGTGYQFRVVATSATEGTIVSPTVAFTTVAGTSSDQRAYELVSPADKVGSVGVGVWGGGMLGALSSGMSAYRGDRFAASGSIGSILLDGATGYASDWAFAERVPAGWMSNSPITHAPSNQQAFRFAIIPSTSDGLETLVWTSNENLLRVFDQLASWPGIGAQFVGDWEGRWEMLAPTELDQIHTESSTQLADSVVSTDGSTVLAALKMDAGGGRAAVGGLEGPDDPAHPDFTDLAFGRAVYVDDVSAGLSDDFDGNGVHSNVGVCTGLAGVDRTEVPAVSGSDLTGLECQAGVDGRDRLISPRGAALGTGGSVENVVSGDGSRVFFLSPDPEATGVPASNCSGSGAGSLCPPQLYVRQRNADGSSTTRWVSRAAAGLFGTQDASLTGTVRFAGASTDGDKVFFQTASPLTADDPNGACGAPCTTGAPSGQSWDLFMYDLPNGPDGNPSTPDADPAGGTLTRISAGPAGTSDCNVVSNPEHAALRFLADDGGRAYFTCAAPLAGAQASPSGGSTSPDGSTATTDATNLYAYDTTGGPAWSFVARLPKTSDLAAECATTGGPPMELLQAKSSGGTIGFSADGNCVSGTADGAFVTFWTTAALTPDDTGPPTVDGYGFDLDAVSLTRITAPQGGVGGTYLCNPQSLVAPVAAVQCHGDSGFAGAALPNLGVATEPPAGERVAFFQTRSRLVAEDVDAAYDVYEWRDGALRLLSTGNSPGDPGIGGTGGAFYKGNDVTGRNVYVATNDKLSWQDFDAVLDIYVARVGGGIPQPAVPQVCAVLGGACQTAGDAPSTTPAPSTGVAPSGDGDAQGRARVALSVRGMSARARRSAARTGVLRVRVGAGDGARVGVVARARLGKRLRVVGSRRARANVDGAVTVGVRLSRAARRRLGSGRGLRVRVAVSSPGARGRSMTVLLRRAGR